MNYKLSIIIKEWRKFILKLLALINLKIELCKDDEYIYSIGVSLIE